MLARMIFLLLLLLTTDILTTNTATAGECNKLEKICSIGGRWKDVDGTRVYRDCWQHKYRFDCEAASLNNCANIDSNECDFLEERCENYQEEGGSKYCTNISRKYVCKREITWEEEKYRLVSQGSVDGANLLCSAFCLDGNCDAVKKAKLEEDEDMVGSIAALNALKDAKDGIVGDVLVNIFGGSSEKCDKKITSYTNCCKKMGGWGKIFGSKCSAEAVNLAKKRHEGKCVELGTYCAKKLPVVGCVIKRTAFCCYDSVISKILNQEAKKQLGRGNGSAESPSCGGLDIEDLEKVDFSNADFSEFYEKIVIPNLNVPDVRRDAASVADSAKRITPTRGFNENAGGGL